MPLEAGDPCALAHEAYDTAAGGESRQPPPQAGIDAAWRAVQSNPALLFHEDIFYLYFGSLPLVDAPPVASQPIRSVRLDYAWGGYGADPMSYTLRIADADSDPRVETSSVAGDLPADGAGGLRPETVQALAQALTDLVPIDRPITLTNCTDNYPDWNVELRFADDSTVVLKTNHSNILMIGGPWQATIDGSDYMQMSGAFATAIYALVAELGLPLGSPAGMTCFPLPIFAVAFGE